MSAAPPELLRTRSNMHDSATEVHTKVLVRGCSAEVVISPRHTANISGHGGLGELTPVTCSSEFSLDFTFVFLSTLGFPVCVTHEQHFVGVFRVF